MIAREQRRRFALGDGLILIAGLAAGLALLKMILGDESWSERYRNAFRGPPDGWNFRYAFTLTLELNILLAIPFMAGWTPACLVVQLTRPRPPWRRLRRQPGFVACLIVTTGLVVIVTVVAALYALRVSGMSALHVSAVRLNLLVGSVAGIGVLWGWATMGLCRACRPVLTWTDRLGRLTGTFWVVVGVVAVSYLGLLWN